MQLFLKRLLMSFIKCMGLLWSYELSSLAHGGEASVKSLWDAGGDVSASVDGTLLSVSEKEPALSLSAAAHQLPQGKKARKPHKQGYSDFSAEGAVAAAGAKGMPCT